MTTTTRHPDAPPTPPTEYRISASAPSGGVAVARAGTASIELDTTWGGARPQVCPDPPSCWPQHSPRAC